MNSASGEAVRWNDGFGVLPAPTFDKGNDMRFQHDCEKCKPLGEFGDADLYYCDVQSIGGATVIARYSDDGGDYQSGMVFADKIPALGEAKKRAIESGYMTPNAELTGARSASERGTSDVE